MTVPVLPAILTLIVCAFATDDAPSDLRGYIVHAGEQNAALSAAWHRWQSAATATGGAGRWPEPTVTFAVFVESIETRTGPQQARIGVQQPLPWPGAIHARTDAAYAQADALQARWEAMGLDLRRQVAEVYWTLWEQRRIHRIHRDHLDVLQSLSTTVRARMEVGQATLADVQQVDLSLARLEDDILSLDETIGATEARLRALLGGDAPSRLPTDEPAPAPAVPSDARAVLWAATLAHPRFADADHRVDAADAVVRQLEINRRPGLSLGADYVLTGPSTMPDTPDSGKDALAIGMGVRVPLWQRSYAADISAAASSASAAEADRQALSDLAAAELDLALADVRDTARRTTITQHTLLPQADGAYQSLLGGYATGRTNVAQVLLAQRDLLVLRVDLERARASHARAWARLESISGRPVRRAPYPLSAESTP